MTILTIMRHAKSSWDDAKLDDFDRPLNDRGWKAAQRMGRELNRRSARFDQVIASPAVRVRETLDGLTDGYGEAFDVHFDRRIYGASCDDLLVLIRRIPGRVHAPLLIGHNPGLHHLVLALTAEGELRHEVEHKFPTAAVAIIELPAVGWDAVEAGSGMLRELIRPKDLD